MTTPIEDIVIVWNGTTSKTKGRIVTADDQTNIYIEDPQFMAEPANPFDNFTPVQKAVIHRMMVSYLQNLKAQVIKLQHVDAELMDEVDLFIEVIEFQMHHFKEIELLFQQCTNQEMLNILPHVDDYITRVKEEKAKYSFPITGAHC